MDNVFTQSIWGDEGFSAVLSMKSIPQIIEIISRDTSPPLFNLTEHIAFQYFGVSEITIRSLVFFYYLLTILFVYLIGQMIWSKKTGIYAALITFFNPFFFIYAFEGRMYSIMSLGATASMYFFIRLYSLKGRKWVNFTGYVFFTLWALYSHHFAFFVVIVQGLWFLYEFFFGKRKTSKLVLKAFVVTGLLYIPWLLPLYKQVTMVKGGFWLGTPTTGDLRTLIYDYLAQGIRNDNLKLPFTKYPLFEVSLYTTFATLLVRRWWKSIQKTIILLMWFLGPILMAWLISQKFTSVFYNRYLLYTIPAIGIIMATARSKLSIYPFLVTLLLFVVIDIDYFTHPKKLPFRDLGQYVAETRHDGDFLINWNSSAHHLWETKFYNFDSPIYVPEGELPFYVGTALMEEKDIARSIPDTAQRVGVTTSGTLDEINLPGYEAQGKKELGSLKFVWYEKIVEDKDTKTKR